MSELKITVLKKTFYPDLVDEYCQSEATPCPHFTEGQEFIVKSVEKPAGFCAWAWNDLFRAYQTLRAGGRFAGWSKNANSFIRCCTHGIRPVVFNLEWIDD
jgi:uncharacterized repeat protein (TIGR04076 family)